MLAFGARCNLKEAQIRAITAETIDAFGAFGPRARQLGVDERLVEQIVAAQRLALL